MFPIEWHLCLLSEPPQLSNMSLVWVFFIFQEVKTRMNKGSVCQLTLLVSVENTELQLQALYLFTKDSNVNSGKSKKRLVLCLVGLGLGLS